MCDHVSDASTILTLMAAKGDVCLNYPYLDGSKRSTVLTLFYVSCCVLFYVSCCVSCCVSPAAKRIREKREKTTSSEALSDNAEDSFPIAASLKKGMSPAVSHAVSDASLSSTCCMPHADV